MPAPPRSLLHSLIQSVGASRPGSWFFARTLPFQDRLMLKLSGGRWTVSSLLAGVPVVWITTTGAKTGKQRTSPLLAIPVPERPDAIAVIGTNFGQQHHPAWFRNLKANPRATCTLRGRTGAYTAHEAAGDEYDGIWRQALDVYKGFPHYKQRIRGREIPILVLTPNAT